MTDATTDPRDIGTRRDGLWCGSQAREVPEDEALPLYECSNCSETSAKRECESCKRIKARVEEVNAGAVFIDVWAASPATSGTGRP